MITIEVSSQISIIRLFFFFFITYESVMKKKCVVASNYQQHQSVSEGDKMWKKKKRVCSAEIKVETLYIEITVVQSSSSFWVTYISWLLGDKQSFTSMRTLSLSPSQVTKQFSSKTVQHHNNVLKEGFLRSTL